MCALHTLSPCDKVEVYLVLVFVGVGLASEWSSEQFVSNEEKYVFSEFVDFWLPPNIIDSNK